MGFHRPFAYHQQFGNLGIGFALPDVLLQIRQFTIQELIKYATLVSIAAILTRQLWVFVTTYIPRIIFPKFAKRHLSRQTLQRAQIGYQALTFRIVRIGIRIPRHFRQRIESAFGSGVITKHAISAPHLLELPQGIGPYSGAAPHLLALNEQRVPVIIVGVNAEQPMVAFGLRAASVRCGAGQGLAFSSFGRSCLPSVPAPAA